jgi:hypothetical protein
MHLLDFIAIACGAIGFFMLALTRTEEKFWRTLWFVFAALNLAVLVFRLLSS